MDTGIILFHSHKNQKKKMKNFVKIRVKSPSMNFGIFIPEKDTFKILQQIRKLHMDNSVHDGANYKKVGGVYQWIDANHLSVSMRKVRINKYKAVQLKNILNTLGQIPV